MAVAILVAELAGFSRSYRERMTAGVVLNRADELHVSLFVGWILLFCAQTMLIATRQARVHRRVGLFAAAWAATMVITAPPLAIGLAKRGFPPGGDPLAFLLVLLVDLLVFAVFVGAGVFYRRQPETHKRFMLLSMISLLPPGVSRWAIAIGNPAPVIAGALIVFLAAPLIADRLAGRRLHRVTLWGGIALFASLPVRFAIAQTATWHHIAQWLTR
jgi:hypothetical protein